MTTDRAATAASTGTVFARGLLFVLSGNMLLDALEAIR